jgi:hypothetical protein
MRIPEERSVGCAATPDAALVVDLRLDAGVRRACRRCARGGRSVTSSAVTWAYPDGRVGDGEIEHVPLRAVGEEADVDQRDHARLAIEQVAQAPAGA